MRATEFVTEIERMPAGDFPGGKEDLNLEKITKKEVYQLPGGSGLLYSIQQDKLETAIKIWDPSTKPQEPQMGSDEWYDGYKNRLKQYNKFHTKVPGALTGRLSVYPAHSFPIPNSVTVGTITVDEDYRGRGIATSLYGIVLSIMKRPLLAGGMQTPGGRRNWLALSRIPGVEVKGYVYVEDRDLNVIKRYDGRTTEKHVDKKIDSLMQLGGQFIGEGNAGSYWAFDLMPGTGELAPAVKSYMSRLYQNEYSGGPTTGMYAIYTGK